MLSKIRARWRLAGILAKAEANGQSVITVPFELVAQVELDIWKRQVATASARWAARESQVSLEDWKSAMRKHHREHSE